MQTDRHPDSPPWTPGPHAALWGLDPSVAFLNHGSFGATPLAVMEAQQAWRRRMEAQPVQFLDRDLPGLLARARQTVSRLMGGQPQDFAFVPNATAAVNTVLASLSFKPGDELLVTDHEYAACRNALDHTAALTGATVRVARLPFPCAGAEDLVRPVVEAFTPRTRFLLMDHITSPTALVLPVGRLCALARSRGVTTMVDGAHVPGQLPVDVEEIGADFYTGNLHKWLCTPKGAAVLHVAPACQGFVRPLAISHGYTREGDPQTRFRAQFDWTGTHDPTACLCVGEALSFLESLYPGGLAALQTRNHTLLCEARDLLLDTLCQPPPCPPDLLPAMAAIPLPTPGPLPGPNAWEDPLKTALWQRFRMELPIIRWPDPSHRLLRISVQAYNDLSQYRHLAGALTILAREGLV